MARERTSYAAAAADPDGSKAERKKERKLCPVFVLKMAPALAAPLKGRYSVTLRLPRLFMSGARLLLREWNGGATGRADLCMVMSLDPSPKDGGYVATISRRWCWWQGLQDERLAPELDALALQAMPDEFPMLTVDDFKGGE